MAQEMNNRETATALGLSENTVEAHVSDLLARLGAVDRSSPILETRKQGLLPLGSQLRAPAKHSHSGGG